MRALTKATMIENVCPSCGGPAEDNWFSRSICAEPCGFMHTRCANCGAALDPCYWDDPDDRRG